MDQGLAEVVVSDELLEKYDRPGPRYTSYPTAPQWEDEDAAAQATRLEASSPRDLSLYFHVPFCKQRCLYCGCSVVITSQEHLGERYVDSLVDEMESVAYHLGGSGRRVRQVHWGGGTPTWLRPEEQERLAAETRRVFSLYADAEVSIEVDPRRATPETLVNLRRLGFNRLSLGVQDFDPTVQEAIRRVQPVAETRELCLEARRLGFSSLNLDLIYGLPHQTEVSFAETVSTILELDPDRIALFSYAHVPWLMRHQSALDTGAMATGRAKFAIFQRALRDLTRAGYEFIGLDHFARPEDELAVQRRVGGLHRNFQGYSTHGGLDLLGFGVTAISSLDRSYSQNESKLIRYQRAVEGDGLASRRGKSLTDDDVRRRRIISDLMCHSRIDVSSIEEELDLDFETEFGVELGDLEELQRDGLLERAGTEIVATALGRVFIRNICMVFDRYLGPREGQETGYSRTV